MKSLVIVAVLVMMTMVMMVDSAEQPQAQNRQMGFVPGGGGYMGGSAMGFYPPMPMPMAMGMGMPGGGGMQLYQQQQQPAYPQMMQQPFMQGGLQGMYNPIRYTQYPAFSHYGAPAMPAHDQQQQDQEEGADVQDEGDTEEGANEEEQEGAEEEATEGKTVEKKKGAAAS